MCSSDSLPLTRSKYGHMLRMIQFALHNYALSFTLRGNGKNAVYLASTYENGGKRSRI